VLWELLLHDPSEEDPVSWALFGAEHIPNWQVIAAGNEAVLRNKCAVKRSRKMLARLH
jgi:hypothetical protein